MFGAAIRGLPAVRGLPAGKTGRMIEPKVMSTAGQLHRVCFALLLVGCVPGVVAAQSFEAEAKPLLEASCLACHGDRTVTPLNLARLGFDLTDRATYRAWERVYERVESGEMPPATDRRDPTPRWSSRPSRR